MATSHEVIIKSTIIENKSAAVDVYMSVLVISILKPLGSYKYFLGIFRDISAHSTKYLPWGSGLLIGE